MEKDEIRKLSEKELNELKITKMIYYNFVNLITKIIDELIKISKEATDEELKDTILMLQETYKSLSISASNKLKKSIQIEKEQVYLYDDQELVDGTILDNITNRLNGEDGLFNRYKQRKFYAVASTKELRNFKHPVLVKEEEIDKISKELVNMFKNAIIANSIFDEKVKSNKLKLSEEKERINNLEKENNMTINDVIEYLKNN